MNKAPTLYVLRDLSRATKRNAREAIQALSPAADWSIRSLSRSIENAARGYLRLEHALWTVLQEPWLGVDLPTWRLAQEWNMQSFLLRHRSSLDRAITNQESFLAPACPALVDDAVSAGYTIHLAVPTPTQILDFTPEEHAQHLGNLFPMAPEQWGDTSAGRGPFHQPGPRIKPFIPAPHSPWSLFPDLCTNDPVPSQEAP